MEILLTLRQLPTTTVVLGLSVFAAFLLKYLKTKNHWKSPNSPPGPWGFPIVGHLPFLRSQPQNTFMKWSKIYGPIFRITFGSHPAVVINGMETLRSILLTNDQDLRRAIAGRPDFPSLKHFNSGYTVVFGTITDPGWSDRKRWLRKTTTHFCSQNRETIETNFIKRAEALAARMNAHRILNPNDEISGTCISAILDMVSHTARTQEDLPKNSFVRDITSIFVEVNKQSMTPIPDLFPILSCFFKHAVERAQRATTAIAGLLSQLLKINVETYSPRNKRDMADHFIKIMSKEYMMSNEMQYDDLKQQLGLFSEFIGATESTAGTQLRWCFMYVATHKEYQDMIQTEIRKVVGEGPVRMDHQKFLVKTQAFIAEVARTCISLPMLLPHKVEEDITIGSYDIPKNTMMLFNAWSALRDPEVWDKPESFIPERFINESGEFRHDLTFSFLHFGGGERRCVGQRIGQWFIFLIFANIMNKCKLSPVPGETYDFNGISNFAFSPKDYKILVEPINRREL